MGSISALDVRAKKTSFLFLPSARIALVPIFEKTLFISEDKKHYPGSYVFSACFFRRSH